MHNDPVTLDSTRFDVRELPCSIKHGLILKRWQALKPGEYFILINGHDPVPLYYQFSAQYPGDFDWSYEYRRENEVAVRISRHPEGVKAPPSWAPPQDAPQCCSGDHDEPADSGDLEVDARGLEPPEPFMRIVAALAELSPGRTLRAYTDRRPIHLLSNLELQGQSSESEELADGSWVTILKKEA